MVPVGFAETHSPPGTELRADRKIASGTWLCVRDSVIQRHRGNQMPPHVSYLSLLRPSTAPVTSTPSASRLSPFLIGNDRGSPLEFPTSDSTITRPCRKSLAGVPARARHYGENGPRCAYATPNLIFPIGRCFVSLIPRAWVLS